MKSLKVILIIAISVVSNGLVNAQVSQTKIDDLINKHLLINESNLSMSGYRVQIYFGQQRTKANEIKTEFSSKFADIPVYLIYQQPNFKVRVGDCKSRLDALRILELIKSSFSIAFVVKDEVLLPLSE